MKIRSVSLAAALAAAMAGCLPPPPPPPSEPGRPLENQYPDELAFADLPVPRNFRYDIHDSWSKKFVDKGNVRLAHLVYHGAAHARDVVKFYDEHMTHPTCGWKKTRDEVERGTGANILAFSKSPEPGRIPENCTVKILRERAVTTVVIDLE